MEFSKYLLEGTPGQSLFTEYLVRRGIKGDGLINNSFARHDRFIKEFIPKLLESIDLRKRNVIEFGFGMGSTTHAISHFAKHVYAFEISEKVFEPVSKRKAIFDLDNVTLIMRPSKTIVKDALKYADKDTIFILFAVLEHMTEEERLEILSSLWEFMGENNYLFVGNTPNRLSHFDIHTHETSFLFSLPDYTCLKYLEIHPEIRFAKELTKAFNDGGLEEFALSRNRRGIGISFHDFIIAFRGYDLNECVVVSDFTRPTKLYDALLTAYFLEYNVNIPMCFSQRDMYFIIKKDKNPIQKLKNVAHNNRVRKEFRDIVGSVFHKAFPKLII
jgi:hypothetical protein